MAQGPAACEACMHARKGAECVSECGSSMYRDGEGQCQPCHELCRHDAGCTGHSAVLGRGGCHLCSGMWIRRNNSRFCFSSTVVQCHIGFYKHEILGVSRLRCFPDTRYFFWKRLVASFYNSSLSGWYVNRRRWKFSLQWLMPSHSLADCWELHCHTIDFTSCLFRNSLISPNAFSTHTNLMTWYCNFYICTVCVFWHITMFMAWRHAICHTSVHHWRRSLDVPSCAVLKQTSSSYTTFGHQRSSGTSDQAAWNDMPASMRSSDPIMFQFYFYLFSLFLTCGR